MNSDELRELAAVYALGAADAGDRARFEALLDAGDPDALSALEEYEETTVALAAAAARPAPPSVRAALMARIAGAEPGVGAAAAPHPTAPVSPVHRPVRRSWWPAVWAAVAAAGIAAIAVGLGVSSLYQRRIDALSGEAASLRAERERDRAVLTLLRDPASQVVALSGLEPAPSARARMIWNAPAGGLLIATGLPPVPPGKTYQLWAIAGRTPVPAGVFGVDARGTASLHVPPLAGVDRVDVFAVTLEPAGGRPAPSGQMYLAGKA
jgi:anti-sigma-K factor RskA